MVRQAKTVPAGRGRRRGVRARRAGGRATSRPSPRATRGGSKGRARPTRCDGAVAVMSQRIVRARIAAWAITVALSRRRRVRRSGAIVSRSLAQGRSGCAPFATLRQHLASFRQKMLSRWPPTASRDVALVANSSHRWCEQIATVVGCARDTLVGGAKLENFFFFFLSWNLLY